MPRLAHGLCRPARRRLPHAVRSFAGAAPTLALPLLFEPRTDMRKLARMAAILGTLLLATRPAGALVPTADDARCSGSGDEDHDGICDAIDNCKTVSNAGQSDLDGDHIGDVCDPEDAPLTPMSVMLGGSASRSYGRLLATGTFAAKGFRAVSGVALRVTDGNGHDVRATWTGMQCRALRAARTFCTDGRNQLLIVPSGPTKLAFRASVRTFVVAGPFAAPLTLTLASDPGVLVVGIDRVGRIGASRCAVTTSRIHCR